MKTTQEVAIEVLVKLSDELKNATQFRAFTDSDYRLAYLYAMSFFENSTNLIAAIRFVDDICARVVKREHDATEDALERLGPLAMAAYKAQRWLHLFTDELRAKYDKFRIPSVEAEIESRIERGQVKETD